MEEPVLFWISIFLSCSSENWVCRRNCPWTEGLGNTIPAGFSDLVQQIHEQMVLLYYIFWILRGSTASHWHLLSHSLPVPRDLSFLSSLALIKWLCRSDSPCRWKPCWHNTSMAFRCNSRNTPSEGTDSLALRVLLGSTVSQWYLLPLPVPQDLSSLSSFVHIKIVQGWLSLCLKTLATQHSKGLLM